MYNSHVPVCKTTAIIELVCVVIMTTIVHCIYFFLFVAFLQGWSKRNAFHVCITSYNIAVTDHRSFKQKKWKYLVLDEVGNRVGLSVYIYG